MPFFNLYIAGLIFASIACGVHMLVNRPQCILLAPKSTGSLSDLLLLAWMVVTTLFITQKLLGLISIQTLSNSWKEVFAGFSIQLVLLFAVALCYHYFPKILGGKPVNAETTSAQYAIGIGCYFFFATLLLIWACAAFWSFLLNLLLSFGFTLNLEPQLLVTLFSKEGGSNLMFTAVVLLFSTLVAPVTEEFLFRAGLYRILKNYMPIWAGLIISGFCFALLHGHWGSFFPLWILGIFLGKAYERTGNILTPIAFHACFNLNTLLVLSLAPENLV